MGHLIVNHDRLGIMRPTVSVPYATGPKDCPKWRTRANWLHLDCNPHSAGDGNGYADIEGVIDSGSATDFTQALLVQGLLSLTDARVEDGGFHCVPGGHRIALEWSKLHQDLSTKD